MTFDPVAGFETSLLSRFLTPMIRTLCFAVRGFFCLDPIYQTDVIGQYSSLTRHFTLICDISDLLYGQGYGNHVLFSGRILSIVFFAEFD
jgi:hypothetical protein